MTEIDGFYGLPTELRDEIRSITNSANPQLTVRHTAASNSASKTKLQDLRVSLPFVVFVVFVCLFVFYLLCFLFFCFCCCCCFVLFCHRFTLRKSFMCIIFSIGCA